MKFVVLLLAIVLEKSSNVRARVQQDKCWLARLEVLESRAALWPIWLHLVVLPVALVALLLGLLMLSGYSWLAFPVHILVLLFALGRGDLLAQLGPFRDAFRRGDQEAAYLALRRDLKLDPQDETQLLAQAQGYLLWQAAQGFFMVIFYYALLGPIAVLAYRLLALLAEHSRSAYGRNHFGRIRHYLDWLPARLLAASFALVGNFAAVGRALLPCALHSQPDAAELVARCGRAALNGEEYAEQITSLDALWQLLIRAAMFWYALLSLWILLV